MFERFTSSARATVIGAQEAARSRQDRWIGSEHLLLALAGSAPGDPARDILHELGLTPTAITAELQQLGPAEPLDSAALGSLGIDLDQVRQRVEAQFGAGALDEASRAPGRRTKRRFFGDRLFGDHLPFLEDAKSTLENALREVIDLGQSEIGSAHVLLGLLRTHSGLGFRVVERKVDVETLRSRVRRSIADAA